LNDAYLAGLPAVRIVHGKGTGVLRQVVRDYLARHPLVRSFETAERRDGGDGVTVAALAN
jgi:DNA mismatch repair protein MutS2